MKIQLFATVFTEKIWGENIGIGRIAAYLKENDRETETIYLGHQDLQKCIEVIDVSSCIFGFSVYPLNIEFCGQLAQEIKRRNNNAVIVFGSKMATTYFERILTDPYYDYVDFVVLGDGEESMLDLVIALEEKQDLDAFIADHPNIAAKKYLENKSPAVLDINAMPYPDRSWLYKSGYIKAIICDCHGCVGRCSFCTQANYYKKWNGRSAQDIFKEMKQIYNNSTVRQFMFTGGSFEDPGKMGKQKIKDLCEMILKNGMRINMTAFMRADTFYDNPQDRYLLNLMGKAGINSIVVGIESGNDEDLKFYNKRATVEDNKRTLRLLKESDMYWAYMGFINFNPYSTLEKLRDNYKFLVDEDACFLYDYTSKLMIHYGTLAYKKALQDGLINDKTKFKWFDGYIYDFIDDDAGDTFEYIKKITGDLDEMARSFEAGASYIDAFSRLLPDNEDFRKEFNNNLAGNAIILKDFFQPIFMQHKLDLSSGIVDTFKFELHENTRRIHKQQSRLTKMLYKNNIFK
ncbi:MAG: B12-binding domain-containing radical SAM protein [Candidatus Aminicenantes bacterium]